MCTISRLSEILGISPLSVGHAFFHHPLKRRIMMLQKMKAAHGRALVILTFALMAGFTSSILLAQSKHTTNHGPDFQRDSTAVALNIHEIMRRPRPMYGEIATLADASIVFKTVDQMPRFNGNMYDWVSHHLHYPESAKARKAEGRSVVKFTVAEDGQISKPMILQSSGHQLLDNEALRIVKEMPAWLPGRQNGRPVSVIFTLPIYFSLDGAAQSGC